MHKNAANKHRDNRYDGDDRNANYANLLIALNTLTGHWTCRVYTLGRRPRIGVCFLRTWSNLALHGFVDRVLGFVEHKAGDETG